MAYPPQPGYPAQMPYHPGQLDGQAKPNGGTTITAGVLAILGGLFGLFMSFFSFGLLSAAPHLNDGASGDSLPTDFVDTFKTIGIISTAVFVIMTLTLIVGAIMLFVRKPVGKWLVTAGCAVNIIGMVVIAIMTSSLVDSIPRDPAVADSMPAALVGASIFYVAMIVLPAIATLVLVLVPPTTRYLTWRPGQGAAYGGQQQYPAQGGYPQAGYPQTPPGGAYGQPQQQQQQWGQQQPPQQW